MIESVAGDNVMKLKAEGVLSTSSCPFFRSILMSLQQSSPSISQAGDGDDFFSC